MKRYFVSAGLIVMSFVYLLTQHSEGSDASPLITGNTGTDTTAGTSTGSQPTYSATSTSSGTTESTSGSTGSSGTKPTGEYKDGSYTGSAANAYYGYVQVKAVVSGGKLTAVQILQYPNDRSTSRYINSQALPYLEQEAVAAQSANVNTVSGASDTSMAFRESLASALTQAKV